MFRNRLYYSIKPLLPATFRLAVRRWFAVRKRERVLGVWPILPGSEKPPVGWRGWPDAKQFAFVLTHDVEGQSGLDKVKRLAELEMRFGFRSSFNLIPEGDYRVPADLRGWLASRGFEVGVHDFRHDGSLFRNRKAFAHSAVRINQYLKDWDATGFRSGFMLRNLDWIHDLNLLYDSSTFDTDPFEPQPDGVATIFPFWIPSPAAPASSSNGNGYAELPYTIPQDSTLFLLLRERHPDIWIQKLDWVAKHGGLALLNVHPDYVQLRGEPPSPLKFPVEFYELFLRYVRERYADRAWCALPGEVASFVKASRLPRPAAAGPVDLSPASGRRKSKPKIWIDLDNTPHVPFFEPILDDLRARGFPVLVTARDAFQVCDLADKKGLACVKVGRHYGKNRLMKGVGLAYRALQLAPLVLHEKPALAVSHGARSQLILGNCLRIPSLLIEDYEYCQFPPLMKPTWLMAPQVIPDSALCLHNHRIRKYPGIKEDVYAWKLQPNFSALQQLGVHPSDLVITVRPPATEAHYHNPESEVLFAAFMNRACQHPQARVVLLPRNRKQADFIRQHWPAWFADQKTLIPQTALDGMNLIWHSDLVVSGGGTMNREAAALGVPVYSIFRGTIGAVDRHLCAEGRLTLVESLTDVENKIQLIKRPRKTVEEITSRQTLQFIVNTITEIAESYAR